MSRQYFADLPNEPLPIANTAVSFATSELCAFGTNTSQWAIPAADVRPGKVWHLTAGGIMTTPAAGTLTITPGWGTAPGASRIALGPSAVQNYVPSISNGAWWLNGLLICRAVGLAGAFSTFIAQGNFNSQGAVATASSGTQIAFGGTQSAVCDPAAGGFYIGFTFSTTAASVTTNILILQSLN